MNTFISAVLVGLVGVFCMWDSRLLGRLNFEQPLVGATPFRPIWSWAASWPLPLRA